MIITIVIMHVEESWYTSKNYMIMIIMIRSRSSLYDHNHYNMIMTIIHLVAPQELQQERVVHLLQCLQLVCFQT